MKPTTLAVIVLVLFAGVYLASNAKRHFSESSTITIQNNDHKEEVIRSGKIKLKIDETGIDSISPGGYLQYAYDDEKFIVKSDSANRLYYYFDGSDTPTTPDATKQKLIQKAIQTLIKFGFNSAEHMEKVYASGGDSALIEEVAHLENENLRMTYLDKVMSSAALSDTILGSILDHLQYLSADQNKAHFLRTISTLLPAHPAITPAFFKSVDNLGSDIQKNAILHILANQENISADLFSSTLEQAGKLNNNIQKTALYNQLISQKQLAANQWKQLIEACSDLNNDIEKSNLLIQISQKMPAEEDIKAAFLKAAETISNPRIYDKVIKPAS